MSVVLKVSEGAAHGCSSGCSRTIGVARWSAPVHSWTTSRASPGTGTGTGTGTGAEIQGQAP